MKSLLFIVLACCLCRYGLSYLMNTNLKLFSRHRNYRLHAINSPKNIPKVIATGLTFLLFTPDFINIFPSSPSYAMAAISKDDASMIRLKASLQELQKLNDDWTSITKVAGAGDNIRRVLGTVYSPPNCDSPLCSSDKFVKRFVTTHLDDIDLDSFDGPSSQYLEALKNADFLAYSSIFSEFTGGGGFGDSSSSSYIDKSRDQVKKAIVNLTEMIKILES